MKTGIRNAIVAEAGRQELSPNALAAAVAGKISRSLVYDYLNGKHDLTTDKADHLRAVLGLKVVGKSRCMDEER